jgi:beta-N-acetylhexosaminidase
VIKHVPGHGRAFADSHLALPVVETPREELEAHDFPPFRILADMPLAMSAHVVYTALDPERPATLSPVVIGDVIRGHMGYDGLLMTDDLSMHALSGSFTGRAEAAIAAGCDMLLHCDGVMEEMTRVAEGAPELAGDALRRAEAAMIRIRHEPEPFDPVDARARLDAALAAVA